MSVADKKLADDRALRDAALNVFRDDLRFIRADLDERGLGGREADRLGDATMDMFDEAVDYAEGNKGQAAAALAAVVLWFARGPIVNGLADLLGSDPDEEHAQGEAR